MTLSAASLVLFGVLGGYLLGSFFSVHNHFEMRITREDLEKGLERVHREEQMEEEARQKQIEIAKEHMKELTSKKDAPKFYKVNLPIVTFADSPEGAYRHVLSSIKKIKGLKFKDSVINEKEVKVKTLSVDDASDIFLKNDVTEYGEN